MSTLGDGEQAVKMVKSGWGEGEGPAGFPSICTVSCFPRKVALKTQKKKSIVSEHTCIAFHFTQGPILGNKTTTTCRCSITGNWKSPHFTSFACCTSQKVLTCLGHISVTSQRTQIRYRNLFQFNTGSKVLACSKWTKTTNY